MNIVEFKSFNCNGIFFKKGIAVINWFLCGYGE